MNFTGRGRQRQVEKGRGRQRQVEKGRDRQRQAEAGRERQGRRVRQGRKRHLEAGEARKVVSNVLSLYIPFQAGRGRKMHGQSLIPYTMM